MKWIILLCLMLLSGCVSSRPEVINNTTMITTEPPTTKPPSLSDDTLKAFMDLCKNQNRTEGTICIIREEEVTGV